MSTPSRGSKDRPRLGRGLGSLISFSEPALAEPAPSEAGSTAPPAAAVTTDEGAVSAASANVSHAGPAEIAVSDIVPNPHQPRREFNQVSLTELAASLKTTGLIQPVVVRQVDGAYELIAGERRLRAAKLAGLERVPAIVRDVDSFTQAQMALVENVQREDLNPLDRAQAYRTIIDQLGLTQTELAGRLGEDRSSIANFLRLLELAEPVRQMLREGRLSVGHAKLLAGVSDPVEQERLANLVISQELSVRNLERVLQDGHDGQPTAKSTHTSANGSAHLQDLEQSIASQLGMRVQVRAGSKGRGRLVIHYASLDQFDDLMGRLGVRTDD